MKIYVEGQSDKDFLEIYLKYLDVEESLYGIDIVGKDNKIGGKNNIINTKSIEKLEDKFLVIFDADDDFEVAKENIKKQIEKINPNAIYEIFLFPNNQDQGNLEDIYKKIALKYELIECFKKYEKCINSHLDEKIKLSGKSMLYAYIEACGLETKIEKIIAKAEFQKIFNLGDEYLMPLKEFLKSHI